jgi:hypothetical protein
LRKTKERGYNGCEPVAKTAATAPGKQRSGIRLPVFFFRHWSNLESAMGKKQKALSRAESRPATPSPAKSDLSSFPHSRANAQGRSSL